MTPVSLGSLCFSLDLWLYEYRHLSGLDSIAITLDDGFFNDGQHLAALLLVEIHKQFLEDLFKVVNVTHRCVEVSL